MPLRALVRRLAPAAALLAVAGCGDASLTASTGPSTPARAERAIEAFRQRHPTEWRVDLGTLRPLARPVFSPACSAGSPRGFVMVRHATADVEIDLAFRCPIGPGDGAAPLQERFAFAVLGRLPHGIAMRGWVFTVLTPTSSFSEGVTFADAASGRVRVTIDTPLYAVQGLDTRSSCLPPADSSYPPECYVTREHRVPLRLTLTAPISTATLR